MTLFVFIQIASAIINLII